MTKWNLMTLVMVAMLPMLGESFASAQVRSDERAIDDEQIAARAKDRLEHVKRWTTASSPNDGSLFVFRDHIPGDSPRVVVAVERGTLKEINGFSGKELLDMASCKIDNSGNGRCFGFPGYIYYFQNNSLIAFHSIFPAKDAANTVKLLVEHYGRASSIIEGEWQNQSGAKFENITATWSTPWGDLVFFERYMELNTSAIEFNMAAVKVDKPKPF